MIRTLLSTVAIVATLLPTQAAPEVVKTGGVITAGKALALCTVPGSGEVWCMGYTLAVVDAMSAHKVGGFPFVGWRACFPDGMAIMHLPKMATDYLRAHPEHKDLGAVSVIAMALSEAYPCK